MDANYEPGAKKWNGYQRIMLMIISRFYAATEG